MPTGYPCVNQQRLFPSRDREGGTRFGVPQGVPMQSWHGVRSLLRHALRSTSGRATAPTHGHLATHLLSYFADAKSIAKLLEPTR